MTTIYLFCIPARGWGADDVIGYAVAADGRGLQSHLSSSAGWARHDMGLTSDCHHDTYAAACPGGYTLEWVDDVDQHPGLLKALALNEQVRDMVAK